MSYLDSPRLHFRGWFQADVSTINNDIRFFQNASFVPDYQRLNQNGSWNPEGTAIFRILDCAVTGGFLDGRALASPADDAVIGMNVQNAADRAPGKLVDLDPQQQMVSQIWGMQVRLAAGPGFETVLKGEFLPAAFINLWRKQQTGVLLDQTLAAYYQSVLTDVVWSDGADASPVLRAMRRASQGSMLSICFNVFGYGRDPKIPRYTMGHIVGTIGPWFSGEPKQFTAGRQMIAEMPGSPIAPANNFQSLQAKVAADGLSITFDLGNSLQIRDANSGLVDIGRLYASVLTSNPDKVQTSVPASGVVIIGEVPYRNPGWYDQTAGVQTFDLSNNPEARTILADHPLAMLTPASAGLYKVLLQESIDGLYVRADNFVFRLNPGETKQIEFYASRFGQPLANTEIALSATEGFMGGSGGGPAPIAPPLNPPPTVPDIATPPDAISFAGSGTTGAGGYASVALVASPTGPRKPRGYIAGQVYGVDYKLATQPAGYVSNAMNYVSILAHSGKQVPDEPAWYSDIQPLFAQFGNLYPIMGKHVVNLGDYRSVVSRLSILRLAFSLPIEDPNHMPVTRDMGEGDRATILKWLDSKGPDGLPPLGSPPAPPAAFAVEAAAAPVSAAPPLDSSQLAGKTAVILGYEQRRAKGEAK